MTDYNSIWRTQDEIRTVVNAVLGECIWNLSYNERRMAIELELTVRLDDFSTRHSAEFGEYFFVFMAVSKYNRVGDRHFCQSPFSFTSLTEQTVRILRNLWL